jgi:hypothetical protein
MSINYKYLKKEKMDTKEIQKAIDTMDQILFVIKSAENKMRYLDESRKNLIGYFPELVKTYSHKIVIMQMSIERLNQRLKRQAENIKNLANK